MRHYVATTYIIDKQKKEILLHYHKKLKSWLPPGGHVEKDESPIETAIREIKEETQIDKVEFISNNTKISKFVDTRAILRELPHFLLEEKIEDNHYHLDWIFFAFYEKNKFNIPNNGTKFRWYNLDGLNQENNIFENVKKLGVYGIQEFCK